MAEETETSWWDTAGDWLSTGWDFVSDAFTTDDGSLDMSTIAGLASGIGSIAQSAGWLDGTFLDNNKPVGYQGKAEKKELVRSRVPNTYDPNRRPGSGGQRYFSQSYFGQGDEIPALRDQTISEAQGYEMLNKANPAQEMRSTPAMAQGGPVQGYFGGGGIRQLRRGMLPTNTQRQAMPNPGTSNPDNPALLQPNQPAGISGLARQYQRTGGNPFNSTGVQTNQTITPEMQARARELARNPMPSAPPSGPRYPAMMMGNAPTTQREMSRPPMQAPAQPSPRNFDFSSRGRRPYRFENGGEVANPMNRQDLVQLYETDPREAFRMVMSGEVGGKPQSLSYARTYLEQLKKAQAAGQLPSQQQPQQQPAPMGAGMAQGGLASMAPKGYYLGGTTDGMADKVPATIDQQQPAALSDGEFVVPADVVSHLGNGNSNAGAKQLYGMMDRIRQARTGTTQQGKQVNPNKFMPV